MRSPHANARSCRTARLVRLAACVPLLGGAVALGCEKHIEEPVVSRAQDATSVTAQPPATAAAATATAPMLLDQGGPLQGGPVTRAHPGPSNRCVKPTPPVAERDAPPRPDPRCPRDPEQPPKLRLGKVTFPDAKGQSVEIEITDNDHDRQRGLMYRRGMPNDHGMIFAFEERSDHAFWMHNTCIPLDMLFIDGDGLVVGIQENTPTISDDTFQVGCASKYVLELNAGWTRAHGVVAGQFVKLEL